MIRRCSRRMIRPRGFAPLFIYFFFGKFFFLEKAKYPVIIWRVQVLVNYGTVSMAGQLMISISAFWRPLMFASEDRVLEGWHLLS